MNSQPNPNVQSSPNDAEEWIPVGPNGEVPPPRRACTKGCSMTFSILLIIEEFAWFIASCVTANGGGIVGTLLGIGICIFIIVDICFEFDTWYKLLFYLKILTWLVTAAFICVLLGFIIYCSVKLNEDITNSSRIYYRVLLILVIILLPLGYGFYAAALFPAIRLYDYELRHARFCQQPALGSIPGTTPQLNVAVLGVPQGAPLGGSGPVPYTVGYGSAPNAGYPSLPPPNPYMQSPSPGYQLPQMAPVPQTFAAGVPPSMPLPQPLSSPAPENMPVGKAYHSSYMK